MCQTNKTLSRNWSCCRETGTHSRIGSDAPPPLTIDHREHCAPDAWCWTVHVFPIQVQVQLDVVVGDALEQWKQLLRHPHYWKTMILKCIQRFILVKSNVTNQTMVHIWSGWFNCWDKKGFKSEFVLMLFIAKGARYGSKVTTQLKLCFGQLPQSLVSEVREPQIDTKGA